MEKFVSGVFEATIHSALSYCVVGESKKTTIDYGTASVDLEREKICLDTSHYLTRLKITNTSGNMVKLLSAYPVISDDFSIADIPSKDWQVFNGARQLNDIPASCCLGFRDASYAECVNRLSEEGAEQKDYREGNSVLSGALITVIKAGKHYVSLEVLTNDNALNDISISSDCKGSVMAVRIGGEFNCLMNDGDVLYTDWVRINTGGNFIRLIDNYAETVRAMSENPVITSSKPAVYRIDTDLSTDTVLEKLAFLKGLGAPFDYVELGMGWHNAVGDWESCQGINISHIASQINKSGYKAGIWTAPFLAEKNSDFFENQKNWILRHADGSVCTYSAYGKEYFVLDISSEECLEHIAMTYQRLSACGFYMHNIDHTGAFMMQKDVVLLDPRLTPAKAYAKALRTIKDSIGENGYLYVNNGFNPSLTGIADTVQVTSDIKIMSARTKANIIPRMINQTAMRGFMSEWWHNCCAMQIDSDFTKKYSGAELKNLLVLEYMNGGMPMVSNLSSNEELKILKYIVPAVKTKTYPREVFDESAYIRVVDNEINGDYHTLCFFNNSFADVDLIFRLDNKTCGGYVDHMSKYNVSSYFGRIKITNCQYDDILRVGTIPANSCEIVKIAKSNRTRVILSDMHFSMGGEVKISKTDSLVSIEGNNPFNCRGTYVVALEDGMTLPDGRTEFTFTVNGEGPFVYEKNIK